MEAFEESFVDVVSMKSFVETTKASVEVTSMESSMNASWKFRKL